MTRIRATLPGRRALLGIDLAVLAWTAAWIAIGLAVADEVEGLTELSGTVRNVGTSLEEAGAALGSVGDLPVLGGSVSDALAEPAARVRDAGASAAASGESSRESIDELSTLLGLAVALIPSVPLLVLYVPLRVSRHREARALDRARREAGDDPLFREFLARRAVQNLSYRRLRPISRAPWREVEGRDRDRLAEAELRRLGLSGGLPPIRKA